MVTGQGVTQGGDVGLTSQGEGGKWFLGAPPLDKGGFGGGGSATTQEVTRGGSTAAIPPISRMLTFGCVGGQEGPPTVDLWGGRSNGWWLGRGNEGIRGGNIQGIFQFEYGTTVGLKLRE